MSIETLTSYGYAAALRQPAPMTPVAMHPDGRSPANEPPARASGADSERQDSLVISDRARQAAALEDPSALQNQDARVEQDPADDPARREDDPQRHDLARPQEEDDKDDDKRGDEDDSASPENPAELSPEDERLLAEMRSTDQKVRAHEQAHASAGATNVRYEYDTGPDGRQYAVAGTADISVQARADDPDSKLDQARQMRTAALAPADPSTQDMAVAAKASRIEMEARREKADAELEDMVEKSSSSSAAPYDFA